MTDDDANGRSPGWWSALRRRVVGATGGDEAGGGAAESGASGARRPERRRGLRGDAAGLMGVLDHVPVGVASLDERGRLLFVNATLAGWLGRSPGDVVNAATHLHDIVRPPRSAGILTIWSSTAATA
ncbi:PAS domain-containing protein, partial [bacterium]|nr:PAS domain-containing protein [bacterium]